MDNELRKYYKEIEKKLCCPKAMRAKFASDIRRMVSDFLNENPNASFVEVKHFLGEPDDIVATFIESIDSSVISRHTKKERYIKTGGILLLVAMLIGAIIFAVYTANIRINAVVTKETTLIIYESVEE
ncbi:MAG: hypothetical protein FWH57_13700 [Oscillospiraceae bacterium]|nr:hypothetical protein [Oscillospiraceae bacterium]